MEAVGNARRDRRSDARCVLRKCRSVVAATAGIDRGLLERSEARECWNSGTSFLWKLDLRGHAFCGVPANDDCEKDYLRDVFEVGLRTFVGLEFPGIAEGWFFRRPWSV